MKKSIKSLTALCLAFLMMLSMIVALPVFADDASATSDTSGEEVETLNEAPYLQTVYGSVEAKIAVMKKGLSNGKIQLYYDPASGEVAFENLETKEVLFTNPYNVSSTTTATNTKASPDTMRELLSQIIITYTENDKQATFYSFKDAAINKQIVVKDIRGGLRVEYTIGREEVRLLVPECITVEDFKYLYDQIAAEDTFFAEKFESYYLYKEINPNDPKQTQLTVQMKWPITNEFPIYVLDQTLKYAEHLRLENIVKEYTDLNFEMIEEMHKKTNFQPKTKEPALFKLALDYTLNNDGVTVNLAANGIRFDSSSYKLENVTYLPYMGSGDIKNEGYVFTPDGSGSLISFADVKGKAVTITDNLYGHDYAFHDITAGANREVMRLPVFGMVQNLIRYRREIEIQEVIDDEGNITEKEVAVDVEVPSPVGYLAIIENGSSLSQITIDNSGIKHNHITVYTKFNPRPKDKYKLDGGLSAGSNAMWTVESKRKYTGDFTIRYIMLKDEEATYAGMARTFQNYLVEKGVLTKLEEKESNIPLYLETLGAIESTKRVMGVPIDTMAPLSSFNLTQDYLNKLIEQDVSNIKLKLTGWYNGGLTSTVPYDLNIEKSLGGSDGFKNLISYAKEKNIELFPDLEFVFVSKDKSFDGFDPQKEAVKTIDNRSTRYREYDYLFQAYRPEPKNFISANVVTKFYEKAYGQYSQYNVGGIGVSNLGSILNSDFNKKAQLNREDSVMLYTRLLAKIKEQNGNVLISGGNYYALQYATDIINVSLENSRSIYSKASVPFMGMVLHGYKEFSGTAINLAGDYRYELLKTIENGAYPYFILALENSSELIESGYTEYYSVRASIWLETIIDTYKELNAATNDVMYAKMVNHEFLDKESRVVRVTYDNGISFVINYTLNDYTLELTDDEGEVTETFIIPSEDFVKFDKSGKVVNLKEAG